MKNDYFRNSLCNTIANLRAGIQHKSFENKCTLQRIEVN